MTNNRQQLRVPARPWWAMPLLFGENAHVTYSPIKLLAASAVHIAREGVDECTRQYLVPSAACSTTRGARYDAATPLLPAASTSHIRHHCHNASTCRMLDHEAGACTCRVHYVTIIVPTTSKRVGQFTCSCPALTASYHLLTMGILARVRGCTCLSTVQDKDE
jgi:hypothetical protein